MKIARTIALGLVIGIALPGAALAKGGDDDNGGGNSRETRVTGSCTAGSSAKLKAKPDDGRLEAEFEVDQNRNGVTWRVVIVATAPWPSPRGRRPARRAARSASSAGSRTAQAATASRPGRRARRARSAPPGSPSDEASPPPGLAKAALVHG